MVPFDDKSPMVTSGIRIGTPAITTRGLMVGDMEIIAQFIDRAIVQRHDEKLIYALKSEVNEFMTDRPLFAAKLQTHSIV